MHPALHASGNNAWVDELWVDEDVRRRGVARALMTAFDV
ncbi:MAG: GNAT family N-acetyltransferase [Micropruina glycogenica]